MSNGRPSLSMTNQQHSNGRGVLTSPAACLGAILFVLSGVCFSEATLAQRRNPSRQARPATQRAIDYSKFSHSTEKHKQTCNTCHKVPTRNWQKAADFPDVADYPDHHACVACHRRQFFKGARPPICTVCHSKVSPRDDARFTFRNPGVMRQFSIEFPHDKHQDVIARVPPAVKPWRQVEFRAASYIFTSPASSWPAAGRWATQTQDDKTKTYNNCAICHGNGARDPLAPAGGWIDSFVPDTATFKVVPTGHSACFNCHWSSQPPVSHDCGGCHKPATPYQAIASPTRISMKFRHGREQHVAECTTCHINITKASSLRGLKPDVPITSCTECHNKDGLRLDVATELQAVDKNAEFVCKYCHTSDAGRRDPPASHYVIAGREPIKRSGIR
ncbi:MAG: hypothetical protein ND866_14130 [Pyrinomonadaceae bacterium]|nr:hypothetical protein [Pyrinomonadaceae bacterium]